MDELKIALLQKELLWEDPAGNRSNFERMMSSLNDRVDLILLPEMFTTGFTMNAEPLAETMNGESISWMKHIASAFQAAVAGSLIVKEGRSYFNRLLFIQPGGEVQHYDKRHLFPLGGEDQVFCAGEDQVVVSFRGWRIRLCICYDLRFPVWSRNRQDTDLLIYAANWPASRQLVWDTLLRARAIENQVYVAGVNRTGKDGMDTNHAGASQVIGPTGEPIVYAGKEGEELLCATLSLTSLKKVREKFPFGNAADAFELFR
ncbi:MAG: amidohydrolase [Marinilabiliales bacterium]|nr:amidohydrolase [Marinilabiliales bacterium]